MNTKTAAPALPFIVPPGGGLDAPLSRLGRIHKVPGSVTAGHLAIVEHTLPPRALAAPLHRHSREDELSIVLAGRIGALLGDDAVEADAGSYVWKPRDQWHTFWNASDTDELRFIELLLPAGFENYFQRLSPMLREAGSADPAAIAALAEEYGIEFDFDSIPGLCERFRLTRAGRHGADRHQHLGLVRLRPRHHGARAGERGGARVRGVGAAIEMRAG
jgi:quercetin dioxygenase-like cupin family protein